MIDYTDHDNCALDHSAKAYHEMEEKYQHEVERLRAQVKTFEDDLLSAKDILEENERLRKTLAAEDVVRQNAQDEHDRLRAALTEILDVATGDFTKYDEYLDETWVASVARQALEGRNK
jgi:hypothetical protein